MMYKNLAKKVTKRIGKIPSFHLACLLVQVLDSPGDAERTGNKSAGVYVTGAPKALNARGLLEFSTRRHKATVGTKSLKVYPSGRAAMQAYDIAYMFLNPSKPAWHFKDNRYTRIMKLLALEKTDLGGVVDRLQLASKTKQGMR